MLQNSSRWLVAAFILTLLGLSACGSSAVLASKSAATPAGIDLSGHWQLRRNGSATGFDADPGLREPPLVIRDLRRQRPVRQRGSSETPARVFLESGSAVKITQTGFGLFISYDRSIVEEYRFGENRMISVGPIEAMRVSGWDGSTFVVETLDKTGAILYESWHLQDDAAVLVRDIRISRDETDSYARQQVFDRT